MKNRAFPRVVAAIAMSGAAWIPGTSGCHRATTPQTVASPAAPDVDAARRDADVANAIARVLDGQRDAWNRGDLEAFMDAYVRDDALVFTSGGKVRRGWDETMRRYRARYVDAAAMGKLTFDELETTVVADDAALVLGRWRLVDTPEAGHGLFTLLFVRRDGRWLILHDHTSAEVVEPPPASPP